MTAIQGNTVRSNFFKILFLFVIVTTSLIVQYLLSNNPLNSFNQEYGKKVHSNRNTDTETRRTQMEPTNGTAERIVKHPLERNRIVQGLAGNKSVSVGYFEDLRSYWVYERLFQPFRGRVDCICGDSQNGSATKRMFTKIPDISKFDIVVFPYDVAVAPGIDDKWKRIHKQRHRSQRWVYATRETPYKLTKSLIPEKFKGNTYHWSCTYRSNADISIPYGYFKRYNIPLETGRNRMNWAQNKTRLLSWMSSNTGKQWNRTGFIHEISELEDIDIYGRLSGISCPRNSTECDQRIGGYKFYFALENSCCSEYISEKFWRTLSIGTVPIVVGAPKQDYLTIAPPNSFIYADDFQSANELVDFLKSVDGNDTKYNEFFRWRELGEAINLFPDLAEHKVVGRTPPLGSFYSCDTACRMAALYNAEIRDKRERKQFFNPRSKQWAGSCWACAQHEWISKFEFR